MDIQHIDTNSINVLPSFGSSASFSSLIQSVSFGDGFTARSTKGINALQMTLNLQFKELTDIETQPLISFLQSHFYYEPQEYSTEGRFTNKRVGTFNYQPFYPYKESNFSCLSYNHSKTYHNCNDVSATFNSVGSSILSSVEPADANIVGAGFNTQILFEFDPTTQVCQLFNESETNSIVINEPVWLYDSNTAETFLISSFPHVIEPSSSETVLVSTRAGNTNPSVGQSPHTNLRNSIFINNPETVSFNSKEYGLYDQTNRNEKTRIKMFNFRPSSTFSLSSSPKYKKSNASDLYSKFNKYGFNPNLSNMTLDFSLRSDREAKNILLFLESHLGYKKFGFHFNKDYQNKTFDTDYHTTPNGREVSTFYCPEWTHTAVYKNNHTISATFIESV